MKKLTIVLVILTGSFMNSCSENNDDAITKEQLTAIETEDLLRLREEEKLARDVYLFSYDKYGQSIFTNIAASEQKHMDKVLTLLNTYGIPDPAFEERGLFKDPVLQQLYDALTSQVSISIVEALKVGATIEDLDIKDIDDFEERTDRLDILNAYDKLKCGSRNHMRSYYGELINNSITYVPQFISLNKLTEIINNSSEQCGK